MKKRQFNPLGRGYDYEGARKAGFSKDETGHWPSRDPKTGVLFKGATHKTFHKTRASEARHGYEISEGKDGRFYSKKKRGVSKKK